MPWVEAHRPTTCPKGTAERVAHTSPHRLWDLRSMHSSGSKDLSGIPSGTCMKTNTVFRVEQAYDYYGTTLTGELTCDPPLRRCVTEGSYDRGGVRVYWSIPLGVTVTGLNGRVLANTLWPLIGQSWTLPSLSLFLLVYSLVCSRICQDLRKNLKQPSKLVNSSVAYSFLICLAR